MTLTPKRTGHREAAALALAANEPVAQVAALCEVTERELRGSRCKMGPGG